MTKEHRLKTSTCPRCYRVARRGFAAGSVRRLCGGLVRPPGFPGGLERASPPLRVPGSSFVCPRCVSSRVRSGLARPCAVWPVAPPGPPSLRVTILRSGYAGTPAASHSLRGAGLRSCSFAPPGRPRLRFADVACLALRCPPAAPLRLAARLAHSTGGSTVGRAIQSLRP